MKLIVIKKKRIYLGLFIISISLLGFNIHNKLYKQNIIMGGNYSIISCENEEKEVMRNIDGNNLEKYFRPSNLQILNDKTYDLENLPKDLNKEPRETIINYYSILREAANPKSNNKTGCGTIGYAKEPYPIAYNFLTSKYQNQLSYNKYLQSFENILHINLIKLEQVQTDENHKDSLKYFIEIETIEGSDKPIGYFGYYYGFIYLDKENNTYKISDTQFYGENYLCTPYHGWKNDAQSLVEIEYGDWCKLIDGELKVESDGYKKNIYFNGTDGYEYKVEFITLTNGDDIKIADFKKIDGKWTYINIDPEKCLDKNNNKK